MVNQALTNGRGTDQRIDSRTPRDEGVGNFVEDLASLAELQARLAVVDVKDAARDLAVPILLTLISLVLVMASLPVAFFAAAWLLADALKLHQAWVLLLTAVGAIVFGIVAACGGGLWFRRAFHGFRRSRQQLWLNLAWVRTVLLSRASLRSGRRL